MIESTAPSATCKPDVDRDCNRSNPVDVDTSMVELAAVDMQVSLTAKNL